MNVPDDVLRAIGGIAVESVWLEVVAASMATNGLNETLNLAGRSGASLRSAERAIEALRDDALREEATAWLARARSLLQSGRNPIVHGLAHYDSEGHWQTVHPRSGDVQELDAEALDRLRHGIENHAAAGLVIASRIWSGPAADSARTGDPI